MRNVCPAEGAAQKPARSGTLGSRTMATITAATRTMYPHDGLPDDVYARVAEKLAEAARQDSGAVRTIEAGVSALNGGRPFAELSADERLETLKGIEGSDFFELVRSTAVAEVYSDQRTWQLGRRGASGRAAGRGTGRSGGRLRRWSRPAARLTVVLAGRPREMAGCRQRPGPGPPDPGRAILGPGQLPEEDPGEIDTGGIGNVPVNRGETGAVEHARGAAVSDEV